MPIKTERLSHWVSIVANVGVMAGLIFLAFEINQNTTQLRRAEMNATHEHFSSWRHTIMENTDLAVIWHTGLSDPGALSSIDRLRFDLAMQEWFWSNFHYWDRARVGAIPENWIPAALETTTGLLKENPGAREWWKHHKGELSADFRAAVDNAAAELRR